MSEENNENIEENEEENVEQTELVVPAGITYA